jgi:hypothetical protein
MVIDKVNIKRLAIGKAEDDSPICPHGHSPKPLQLTFESMKPKARPVQSFNRLGGIKCG